MLGATEENLKMFDFIKAYTILGVLAIPSIAQQYLLETLTTRSPNDQGAFCCKTGECLPQAFICDKNPNCAGGEDEAQELCKPSACSNGFFKCLHEGTVTCLPPELRCNLVPDCPDKSDEQNCTASFCSSISKFKCQLSAEVLARSDAVDVPCIPNRLVCDGRPHCPGSSDEAGCTADYCASIGKFKCSSTPRDTPELCIHKEQRCNTYIDCPDGSDEIGCSQYYDCNDTRIFASCVQHPRRFEPYGPAWGPMCVLKDQVCDKRSDCYGGTDETNCTTSRPCKATEFRCSDDLCIPRNQMCNYQTECIDGADERNCTYQAFGFGAAIINPKGAAGESGINVITYAINVLLCACLIAFYA